MMEMRPEGKKFDSEEEGEGSELRSMHPEVLVVDDNHMNVEVMQAMLV